MYQRRDGRSDYQQHLESVIIERLNARFKTKKLKCDRFLSIPKEKGSKIKPDIYSASKKIIGEIHVHLGKLKSSQLDKVAVDILKLHLFDPDDKFQKYLVVCSPEEYTQLQGKSYVAAAIRRYHIHLEYVELEEDEYKLLRETMKKQNMFYEQTSEEVRAEYEELFGNPAPLMLLLGMSEEDMKKAMQDAIESGTEIRIDVPPDAVI